MRDHQSRALIGIKRLGHLFLGEIVKRRCRFVKDQDPGVGRDGSRDQKPLLLAAGYAALSLGDDRLHAHGHFPDIIRYTCRLSCLPGVIQSQPRRGNGDILKYTAHHELSVLHDYADMPSERAKVQSADIFAVVIDGTLFGFLKAQQDPYQCGLSASGLTDDRDIFSRLDPDAQIVQDIRHVVRISETHMAHFNVSAEPGHSLLSAGCFRLLIQDRLHHLISRTYTRDQERDARHLHKSACDISVSGRERNIVVIADAAFDGGTVHDHHADQVDSRRDHRVHLDDQRRIIQKSRFFGVEPSPAGKGALLGAGQLDLLDAGDHGVIHTVFLRRQLHGRPRHLRIEQRRYDREYDRRKRDRQCRYYKRRCIVEDLSDVDHRKQRCKSC